MEDVMADPEDVAILKGELQKVVAYHEYENMDHFSFVVGKEMGYVDDVITTLT